MKKKSCWLLVVLMVIFIFSNSAASARHVQRHDLTVSEWVRRYWIPSACIRKRIF